MGYGTYSETAHEALTRGRAGLGERDVFAATRCPPALDPKGVAYRESRDGPAHPASVPVLFALDVSGSMGDIPVALATRTMPTFMQLVRRLVPDVQVCFAGVGNAYTDQSPVQVGQFESEAERIDAGLSALHLEGGGGGLCESYDLAFYFAARHTRFDHDEKRHRKGYLFVTGDEPPFAVVDAALVARVFGDTMQDSLDIYTVIEEAQRRWHVFFLIPDPHRYTRFDTGPVWKNLLHEACVTLQTPEDAALVAAMLVALTEGAVVGAAAVGPALGAVDAAQAERVQATVAAYAEAILRGPLPPPIRMGTRPPDPSVVG